MSMCHRCSSVDWSSVNQSSSTLQSLPLEDLERTLGWLLMRAPDLSLPRGNRWCRRATSSYGSMVLNDTKLTRPSELIAEPCRDIWISESRVNRTWWETVFAEQHQQTRDNTVLWVWKLSQLQLRLRAKIVLDVSSSAGDTWHNASVVTMPGHQSTSGMRPWYVVQSASSSLDFSSLSEFVSAPRLDSSTSALIPFFNSRSSLAIPFFSRSIIFFDPLDIFLLWRDSNHLDWPESTNFLPTFATHLPHLRTAMECLYSMCLVPPTPSSYRTSILFVLLVSWFVFPTCLNCLLHPSRLLIACSFLRRGWLLCVIFLSHFQPLVESRSHICRHSYPLLWSLWRLRSCTNVDFFLLSCWTESFVSLLPSSPCSRPYRTVFTNWRFSK